MKKNNVFISFIVIIGVLMSGCAKNIWTNPNLSDLQKQKDLAQCQHNAEIKNESMQSCMTSKGYQLMSSNQ
ncbi:MAG: hypothetical protein ACXWE9_05425 [Methylobacter sp.]